MDNTPAVQVLGSDVIVACPAQSKGLQNRASAAAIGGLAGVLAMKVLQKNKADDTAPGGHVGQIFVCLGDTRIAFFEQKNGLTGSSLGRLLAVNDLTEITACDWRPSKFSLCNLTITAADAPPYELQIALMHKGKASQIAEAVRRRSEAAA